MLERRWDEARALKSGDRLVVETCRMILSGIKDEEIARCRPLTEEETAAVLTRAVKSRKDSVALFEKGGRVDERLANQIAASHLA